MMVVNCLNRDFWGLGIGLIRSGGLEVGFYNTELVVLVICDWIIGYWSLCYLSAGHEYATSTGHCAAHQNGGTVLNCSKIIYAICEC
jgi:hypothetical protein